MSDEILEPFEPKNELERLLAAAHDGAVSGDAFIEKLLTSEVFMPIYEDSGIRGFQRSTSARPLVLEADDGSRVVFLFTSPERAKPVVRDFPGYEGGLLTEFKWVLEKLGDGYAIALNPGWDIGFDMEAEMVRRLKGELGREDGTLGTPG